MRRRAWLKGSSAALGVGVAATGLWSTRSRAAGEDYRALVVLLLEGGCDGHNVLVPADGAYTDYQRSRTVLALSRASLAPLPGRVDGRTFALHPALAALAVPYAERRLAFVANAGPLVQPVTAAEVLAGTAPMPMFLLSHSDQLLLQQGRDPDVHLTSGWAGRGLEALPQELQHPLAGIDLNGDNVLVRGRQTPAVFMRDTYPSNWAYVDFLAPQDRALQAYRELGNSQHRNRYKAQYARTLQGAVEGDARLNRLSTRTVAPSQDFGSGNLGSRLRQLASFLPVFAAEGLRRQVFALRWGQFDSHTGQRGSGKLTQDTQLAELSKALVAFDAALHATGLRDQVTLLMQSDFGRTLRASSGGGSEHAWGNHLFALGGAVAGGTVHGVFPGLTLGGPDDHDADRGGRHVPTTSSDQVAASVLRWLGVPAGRLHDVFPWLRNFAAPTIPLMQG